MGIAVGEPPAIQLGEKKRCPACGKHAVSFKRTACHDAGWMYSYYAFNALAEHLSMYATNRGFKHEEREVAKALVERINPKDDARRAWKVFLCGLATEAWSQDYYERRMPVHLHVACKTDDGGCGYEWAERAYEERLRDVDINIALDTPVRPAAKTVNDSEVRFWRYWRYFIWALAAAIVVVSALGIGGAL